MEELRPARRSSGIHEVNYGSTHSLNSAASLRGHAAIPAGSRFSEGVGVARTTGAGVAPIGAAAATSGTGEVPQWDQSAAPPAAAPAVPFYKKRWFIISQIIFIPLGIALLFILLFPVLRAIAQLVVKRSQLGVDVAAISQPQNNTFSLKLEGNVTHTGIFPAKIQFLEPIRVAWVEDDGTETPLGTMNLTTLSAKHKRAPVDQTTTFIITDEAAFGRFSAHLITAPNFTWRMQSSNLRVQALKFPVAKGISFDKKLTLNGFNSFDGNVLLKDLQLPSDNPAGGLNFKAITQLNNPSPFSLNLGTVIFALSYQNVPLGMGTGRNTVINPGLNDITLEGVLERKTDPSDLALVSKLFTSYLNGDNSPVIATGQSTLQTDNSTISWLSQGLQSLALNVPFKPLNPIDSIRSITMGNLALQFDENSPWTPNAESNSVQAKLQLPFGFNLAIDQIQNEFNIVTNDGANVAGLSTPLGASQSSISVLSPVDTEGTINISISNTKLSCPDPQHPAFSKFNAELTSLDIAQFRLVGRSRAVANTSIGQLTLDPIKVNVSTALNGLKGLKGLTTIKSVDVQGGSQDGINLGIDVSIFNPSSLDLATGDLTLKLFREGVGLGTALLPNLTLVRGNNTFHASSSFEANKSPQGLQTLSDFVGKKDVQLSIAGFDGSTKIASLAEAFKTLNIDVTLPGLKTNLLDTASLTVLSTTGRENNISHVTVSLVNPFSAPLQITKITSTVKAFGIPLGTIETNTNFQSAPKSTTKSPTLDLNMNFDPAALFTVTRALAVEAGLDVDPLDGIVELGGIEYLSITGDPPKLKRRANLFTGFNLPKFVHAAFKKLRSDVELVADVTIGEYKTTLQYTQTSVPTATDQSLDFILPVLAQPIVQKIVDGSSLGISTVLITDPKQTAFGTQLKGNIGNAGPFDAVISFPSGLTIGWNGKALGGVTMGDVKVIGDVGGAIDAASSFEVADVAHLTDFTKTLLTQESFDWDISGENLTVTALGIHVPGIALSSKRVTLKGFNGLKDGVKIKNFDLPSDDPAGGIHLTLDAATTNPSQVGIVSSIGFDTYVGDIMIAPVLSVGAVTLAPGSTSDLSLAGRLVPQNSPAGLSTVSEIFNNFLHGKDSNVEVRGASAGSKDVTWLNEGIKSLRISTVLPNRGVVDIIQAIALNDLSVTMEKPEQAFAPLTSSEHSVAKYKNPFGFSLQVIAAGQDLVLNSHGVDIAQLTLPQIPVVGGVSTGNVADLVISFHDQPLKALNPAAFAQMLGGVTLLDKLDLILKGSADVTAKTPVGNVAISGVKFNVPSSLKGINSFGHTASLSKVSVAGSGGAGGSEYVISPLTTVLQNPSHVSLNTVDISLPVMFKGTKIGRAVINPFHLKPGENPSATEFRYQPDNANDTTAQAFLAEFIGTGDQLDLTIHGDQNSSPIPSLSPGLAELQLSTSLTGLNHPTLITHVTVTITLDTLVTNLVFVNFDLHNPLDADLVIEFVQADSGVNGKTYAQFGQPFTSFVVPPGQTVNSGDFPNVLLTQGAIPSLEIIPLGYLDISARNTVRAGQGGYQIPWLPLEQKHVPTTYNLALGLAEMKQKAKQISASSSTVESSTSAKPEASLTSAVDNSESPASTPKPSADVSPPENSAPAPPTATTASESPASTPNPSADVLPLPPVTE